MAEAPGVDDLQRFQPDLSRQNFAFLLVHGEFLPFRFLNCTPCTPRGVESAGRQHLSAKGNRSYVYANRNGKNTTSASGYHKKKKFKRPFLGKTGFFRGKFSPPNKNQRIEQYYRTKMCDLHKNKSGFFYILPQVPIARQPTFRFSQGNFRRDPAPQRRSGCKKGGKRLRPMGRSGPKKGSDVCTAEIADFIWKIQRNFIDKDSKIRYSKEARKRKCVLFFREMRKRLRKS